METITLTIPGMKSPHCEMTVTNTVTSIGATVRSLAHAKAEVELKNGLTKDVVIRAIENAGYKVSN